MKELWDSHLRGGGGSTPRLVEPFCGGIAITLGLLPENALLNDVNPQLINFYKWLKRGLKIDIRQENDREIYQAHKQRFNQLLKQGEGKTAEAASLFYYLNRTGYNGLCRFNQSGEFNVPFGQYKKIPYKYDFTDYREQFAKWEFTNCYFDEIAICPGDFIYADPPYDVVFRQYSKGGFGWDEQVKAAEWLGKHNGPVVLSNQATDRIISLYQSLGFHLEFLDAPRRISCTGDRTPAREVLALRNL